MQRCRRLRAVEPLDGVHDPCRPIHAEPALAGAHTQPEAAADVVEVRRPAPMELLFEPPAADQLTLADQLVVFHRALAPAQPGADGIELAVLVAGRLDLLRAA